MKISFVIPAYNEEDFLADCVRSILAQRADADVEIVVVNNASTDNTAQVARNFPEVVVVDESRKGLTFARQAGFMRATGDLIVQLDADSRLTPGWIRKMASKFAQNSKLAAVTGPVVYYDLPAWQNLLVRTYYYIAFASYLLNRYVLRVGSMVQGSNVAVRREMLKKIGGYDTQIAFYGEDTDLAKRIFDAGGEVEFGFATPILTSARRFHAEGLVRTGLRYAINYFWVIFSGSPYSENYSDIRMRPNEIFLTFDDGPNEPYTSLILTTLKKYNAHATFFVIGQNAKRSPETLKRIVAEGHSIGVHSYTHNPLRALSGIMFDEILRTQKLIKEITGVETHLYRSPWGITMPWLKHRLKTAGFQTYHWDVMAHDWWPTSADYITEHVTERVRGGEIVLLHDGDQLRNSSRAATAVAAEVILKRLTAGGFRFMGLNEHSRYGSPITTLAKDNLAWAAYKTYGK